MNIIQGCAVTTIFLIVMLAGIIFLTHKKNDVRTRRLAAISCSIVGGIYCITMSWLGLLYFNSMTHGNDDPWLDIGTMAKYTANTHAEDKLPANLKGSVLIFFRFDCGSCHDTHAELTKLVSGYDNIYYVSSRSEKGAELRDKYLVTEVPSAIYIPVDPDETPTVEPLSTTETLPGGSNVTVVDKEKLNIILNLLREQR